MLEIIKVGAGLILLYQEKCRYLSMPRLKKPAPAAVIGFAFLCAACGPVAAESNSWWQAPDRNAKVAGLIPGRSVAMPPPAEFMAEWTRQQLKKWEKTHGTYSAEKSYDEHKQREPADDKLREMMPDHISPFAIVISGKVDPEKASHAMFLYCPLCDSEGLGFIPDPKDPFHVTTSCCRRDLYLREKDFPPDYTLRPNSTAKFQHLDDTVKEVPGVIFTNKNGIVWQIFPGTMEAHRRWRNIIHEWAFDFLPGFKNTADPVWVHKLAAALDRVADVYYGLPLSYQNELATGKDGRPLTRAEWEALPRPVRTGSAFVPPGLTVAAGGFAWNRLQPSFNRGWAFQAGELRWVEPFARARHHPAFKEYSRRVYGDPEALDKKIMSKLMRELALMFKSFTLLSDYQDGSYADLLMLAILTQDRYLFDFAAGHQECVLYDHHYHDGMNGEGAPNYMGMLRGYYAYMADPGGWLEFMPDFLNKNPFFKVAATEWRELHTARNLPLEFGDQHIYAYQGAFAAGTAKTRNESLPSMNWPGFGIGLLRVGGADHRQEMFMTYDRVSLHSHDDKLGIECWFDGVPVMREGGYAASSWFVPLAGPEIKALSELYPREVFEIFKRPGGFVWEWREWTHGPWARSTITINEIGTGRDWNENEGFGELLTFKGGETHGEPGSRFQVLDCRVIDSFDRVGLKEFRRTLMGVEGPEGRPYFADIVRVNGGQRHALFLSAWADPVGEKNQPATGQAANYAEYLDTVREQPRENLPFRGSYEKIRNVTIHPASNLWEVTWKTDYAAYAPFKPAPVPDEPGIVFLRMIGMNLNKSPTTLLRAKGPWVAKIEQSLPNGTRISGNVGFRDAWDYMIESRATGNNSTNQTLQSAFVHIIEGYHEKEDSVIRKVKLMAPQAGSPPLSETIGFKLSFASGHTDLIVFQPEAGPVRFQNGVETDARYAFIRLDGKGELMEADMVRGTRLKCGDFEAELAGDYHGAIVDVIGDLTGTRQETALIIRPDTSWPIGNALVGRQISIGVINHPPSVVRHGGRRTGHDEAYTIEKVTSRPDGLLRVDLANHAPLSLGWYQVSGLDKNKSNRLTSCRELWAGIDTTWWRGAKAWFPERNRTFTILTTDNDRTTMEVETTANLKAQGIQPGDWFLIYFIEPGNRVVVPCEFALSREHLRPPAKTQTDKSWRGRMRAIWRGEGTASFVYRVKTTGKAAFSMPVPENLWRKDGTNKWMRVAIPPAQKDKMVIALTGEGDENVRLAANLPEGVCLEDSGPPIITNALLDGRQIDIKPAVDLGRIPAPRMLTLVCVDHENPIDIGSLRVCVDGARIDEKQGMITTREITPDGKNMEIAVNLEKTLADEPPEIPAYHTVSVTVDDFAVDEKACTMSFSYLKQAKMPGNAVYLSDLRETSSVVHGFQKDSNYYGKPLVIHRKIYGKGLHTSPEIGPNGNFSEVIYDLSAVPGRKHFTAEIGISDDSDGQGSVIFQVQTAREDGKWETRYTSPVLRGGQATLPISVDIAGAKKIRLYCTDAGDGIGGDHASWANARLE